MLDIKSILICHNKYKIFGGEDVVYQNETQLLKSFGVEVEQFNCSNDNVDGLRGKLIAAINCVFSISVKRLIEFKLCELKPDVIHVHNYFPIISPSIFYACKKMDVPVVHTLHNYRAICPTALLMYKGKIEERSIRKSVWWAVPNKVYRDSFLGTFILTLMIYVHKKLGTWNKKVDRYIALTEFSKQKYIEAGWPKDKIRVKPNFSYDPYTGASEIPKKGGYALFVGRLSEEKGAGVLVNAWSSLDLPLKVIGDGPLAAQLRSNSSDVVDYLGSCDKKDVLDMMCDADFIIMPSVCYETFGMVIIEAFSCGTPVLCSRLGSMEEIVKDGTTGLHFEAGNKKDLAEKAQWLIDNPQRVREMGRNARNEYLAKFTPEKNYDMLMDIYQQAIDEAKKH